MYSIKKEDTIQLNKIIIAVSYFKIQYLIFFHQSKFAC